MSCLNVDNKLVEHTLFSAAVQNKVYNMYQYFEGWMIQKSCMMTEHLRVSVIDPWTKNSFFFWLNSLELDIS